MIGNGMIGNGMIGNGMIGNVRSKDKGKLSSKYK
jgi:hypothetical protein